MILIKNKLAIDKMRAGGELLATVMHEVRTHVVIGQTTLQIDNFIEKRIRELGMHPSCKGYAGYMHSSCISLNDVIVHGVPSDKIVLKSGDFVKIDVVASYRGYCVDMARFFFVGDVDPNIIKLAETSQIALDNAISCTIEGNKISDISHCVQTEVEKKGFSVIRKFAGHGIGKSIHEEPDVPNFGKPGRGPILRSGMTLAIEPMIAQMGYEIVIMDDGWTAKTLDGGIASHVEDTVLVTSNGPQVLTRI